MKLRLIPPQVELEAWADLGNRSHVYSSHNFTGLVVLISLSPLLFYQEEIS